MTTTGTSPAANPSTFHRSMVTTAGAVGLLYIETCDLVVLTQDKALQGAVQLVPDTASLVVLGDVVIVAGPLNLKGRDVQIYCRQLVTMPDTGGKAASINVDGAAGTQGVANAQYAAANGADATPGGGGKGGSATEHPEMNGRKGGNGTAGGKAGNVCIVCGSMAPAVDLTLSACGGTGGSGTWGQSGGRGGAGGSGQAGTAKYSTDIELRWHLSVTGYPILNPPTAGGPGGKGGRGGDGGDAGRGGSGGRIDFAVLRPPAGNEVVVKGWRQSAGGNRHFLSVGTTQPSAARIEMNAAEGTDGQIGAPGSPGEGGVRGAGGAGVTVTWSDGSEATSCPQAAYGEPGARGDAGRGGNLVGPVAVPGTSRLFASPGNVDLMPLAERVAGEWSWYASMLLQKARTHYLAAGDGDNPDEKNAAEDILLWLDGILDAAPQKPNDARVKAMSASAGALLLQLTGDKNYFGEPRTFVPRISFASLRTEVREALAAMATLEPAAKAYQSAMLDAASAAANLRVAIGSASSRIAACEQQLTELDGAQRRLIVSIQESDAEIKTAAQALKDSSSAFSKAISDATNGLSDEDFFSAMEQLSFTSEESPQSGLMIGAQVGRIQNKLKNYVTDATGESYKKKYIVHSIVLVTRDSGGLAGAWKQVRADGTIAADDRPLNRLLMSRQMFNQVCDRFYGLLPDAAKAREAMDGLVDVVERRNVLIDAYNAVIAARADLAAERDKATADLLELQGQLAGHAAPDLAVRATFISGLYDHVKAHSIRSLYRSVRALGFWSLRPLALFSEVLGNRHPNDIDHLTLTACWSRVSEKLDTALDGFSVAPQKIPPTTVRLSALNKAALKRFQKTGVCSFAIRSPGHAGLFPGFADVRLSKMRAWLEGALFDAAVPAADRTVRVGIRHMGTETIVHPDGTGRRFEHRPVPGNFFYNASNRQVLSEVVQADLGVPEPKNGYAPVGPFAGWRIEASRKLNPLLKWDLVDDVVLEFHGTGRPAN